MTCEACKKRVKDWQGDDPRCAFDGHEFSADNWNCKTVNIVRNIAERYDTVWQDDENYACIPLNEVVDNALCLWVQWYKSRGRTQAMWILSHDMPPRRPTEGDLVKIIMRYSPSETNP